MSSDKSLITKMLNELRSTRSSIKKQNAVIADVLDKSNNVLIQIEAARCIKPSSSDTAIPYLYNKETISVLTKIVDKFTNLVSDYCHVPTENADFEEYLQATAQRADCLGGNIRKLLAIWDIVQQMRTILQRQELEINSNDESDEFL